MYKMCINKNVVEVELNSDNLNLLFDICDEVNRIIDETYPEGAWNEKD